MNKCKTKSLNDSFMGLSEQMANELLDSFAKLGKALEDTNKIIASYGNSIRHTINVSLIDKVQYYSRKVSTSCFITRWWYRKKLRQAIENLRFWERMQNGDYGKN